MIVLAVPPFLHNFGHLVHLGPGAPSWMLNDPTEKDDMNQLVGGAFTGWSLSYLFNLLIFFLHPWSSACIVAAIAYLSFNLLWLKNDLVTPTSLPMLRLLSLLPLLGMMVCVLPVIVIY